MGCLGVHFALTEDEVACLRSIPNEGERLSHLQEVIEEEYLADDAEFAVESDKAWDAIHRTLTDGQLGWDNGDYPLNHAVLGGELLYTGSDYIVSLKSPDQVREIADAMRDITEAEFRVRYFTINPESYGFPVSDEDFSYTWHWFQGVRRLYQIAAENHRFVLFTADQ